MELFVPMASPTSYQSEAKPRLKQLTQHVRAKLSDVMLIVTEDFDGVQDSFVFRDGFLMAEFDARRGEPQFYMSRELDFALSRLGFRRVSSPELTTPDNPQDHVNAYLSGTTLVIVAFEVSDRGKHITYDIRFCELNPKYGMPQSINR